MNNKEYIGKPLIKLIKDMPDYAINFYEVSCEGKIYKLKDIFYNEQYINRNINDIGNLTSDYSYLIELS